MPTLETLSRSIRTAHDLLSVVKTMKSLAAVNIRQFERAVASLEQYCRVVDMGWTVVSQNGAPHAPAVPKRCECLLSGGIRSRHVRPV